MINQSVIEGLTAQLAGLIDSARNHSASGDLEPQISAILKGAFNRMDLVTRDEFDAQSAVLARTREKLEHLQQQLDQLEQQLDQD
ncbi:MAG: accessory factor UbiK family protein [Amphritea sp.]|nr:accessory factor UbiK family protein [Amphritea sp.]